MCMVTEHLVGEPVGATATTQLGGLSGVPSVGHCPAVVRMTFCTALALFEAVLGDRAVAPDYFLARRTGSLAFCEYRMRTTPLMWSRHLCGWRWWERIWERRGAVGLGQMRAAVAVSGVKRALSCGNSSEVERFGGDVRCSHRGGQGFKSPQLHRRSEAGSDSRNRPLALSGVRFGSGLGSRVRTPCCEEEEAGASLPLGGPGHSASLRPSTTELPMR